MPSLQQTIDKHLRAICERDLAALQETVAMGDIVLITAEGRLVRDPAVFFEMHRQWFASDAWQLGTEPVCQWESQSLGVVVLKLDYCESPPGKPQLHAESFLTLVFQRQADRWLLVQDQNTPCKGTSS
ncbi:MAG: nuclear transport factor 2 family protein [Pirellulales bacterium]|nr:nuclear transport factor 2 family protein [Pirellulales bacterium]